MVWLMFFFLYSNTVAVQSLSSHVHYVHTYIMAVLRSQ